MIRRAILQGQYRDAEDRADGIWYWSITDGEDPYPRDRNTAGFMGCGLIRIWHADPLRFSDWPEKDFELFKDAVKRSADGGLRHFVRIGYTNPQFLDYYLCFVAADLLNEPSMKDRAREHLEKFIKFTNTYCLGSINELDCWLQRRPLVVYWNDRDGKTTGLKLHARFDCDDRIDGWLVQEALEFISLQHENEAIGAFVNAAVVAARPGETLQAPADTVAIGRRGLFQPKIRSAIYWGVTGDSRSSPNGSPRR